MGIDSSECRNPFFYPLSDNYDADTVGQSVSAVTSARNEHSGIRHPFSLEQIDGIFIILVFCFILTIRLYKKGITFFKENIQLILSSRENVNMLSETTISEYWLSFLLLFQTAFLSSIVLFSYYSESDAGSLANGSLFTVLLFTAVILIFEGIKILLYKFLGYLFNVSSIPSVYIRGYVVLLELLGLFLFIPSLLLIYSDYWHNIIFILCAVLFLISRLIIFHKIFLFFFQKNVNFLYLIVYLCSVEVIPYVLLYYGLIFIYKTDVVA